MPKTGLRDFYIETILELRKEGPCCENDTQFSKDKEESFHISHANNSKKQINSACNDEGQHKQKTFATSSSDSKGDISRYLHKNMKGSKSKSQEQDSKAQNENSPNSSLTELHRSDNRKNLFIGRQETSSESPISKQQSLHLSKLPAWIYCTRYSDRPCSRPRSRKHRRKLVSSAEERKPRAVFTAVQLRLLKREFEKCPYLSEERRETLAEDLNLTLSQVKVWFQNKRAKLKKTCGGANGLALDLKEQGLYDH